MSHFSSLKKIWLQIQLHIFGIWEIAFPKKQQPKQPVYTRRVCLDDTGLADYCAKSERGEFLFQGVVVNAPIYTAEQKAADIAALRGYTSKYSGMFDGAAKLLAEREQAPSREPLPGDDSTLDLVRKMAARGNITDQCSTTAAELAAEDKRRRKLYPKK